MTIPFGVTFLRIVQVLLSMKSQKNFKLVHTAAVLMERELSLRFELIGEWYQRGGQCRKEAGDEIGRVVFAVGVIVMVLVLLLNGDEEDGGPCIEGRSLRI